MMRKRQSWLTISYVVYPPNFVPLSKTHRSAKNLKAAMTIARGFGVGARIHRSIDFRHRPRFKSKKPYCAGGSRFEHYLTLE